MLRKFLISLFAGFSAFALSSCNNDLSSSFSEINYSPSFPVYWGYPIPYYGEHFLLYGYNNDYRFGSCGISNSYLVHYGSEDEKLLLAYVKDDDYSRLEEIFPSVLENANNIDMFASQDNIDVVDGRYYYALKRSELEIEVHWLEAPLTEIERDYGGYRLIAAFRQKPIIFLEALHPYLEIDKEAKFLVRAHLYFEDEEISLIDENTQGLDDYFEDSDQRELLHLENSVFESRKNGYYIQISREEDETLASEILIAITAPNLTFNDESFLEMVSLQNEFKLIEYQDELCLEMRRYYTDQNEARHDLLNEEYESSWEVPDLFESYQEEFKEALVLDSYEGGNTSLFSYREVISFLQ